MRLALIAMLLVLAVLSTGCGGSSATSGINVQTYNWQVSIVDTYPSGTLVVGDAVSVVFQVKNTGGAAAPATMSYWQVYDPASATWATLDQSAIPAQAVGELGVVTVAASSSQALTATFRLVILDSDLTAADNTAPLNITWVAGGAG